MGIAHYLNMIVLFMFKRTKNFPAIVIMIIFILESTVKNSKMFSDLKGGYYEQALEQH
ncbi:hypothetical protein DCCM_2189 [Desulfocucumis palustris]|uniref:Uncharacterized protein n=1 Tax=Desulfocucumis palustris TaxID=1898651 RepID=A0A2L2XAK2_9FIRM|nr:hypothetical protein DCCM_2189 [Desulfocucumis palustris]